MKTRKKRQLKTVLATVFALALCFILFAIFRAGVGEAESEAVSVSDGAEVLRLTSGETEEQSAGITALREAIAAFENADFTNGIGANETLNSTMPASSGGAPTLYPETGEHPRVGITSSQLEYIKNEYLSTAEGKYLLGRLKEIAAQSFTGELGEPTQRTDRAGYHNVDEKVLATIEARAFLYLLTDDEEYGYNAILSMKNYLSTLRLYYITSDQCREFGRTMFVTAEIYDWCYDLLTEKDKEQFILSMTFIASGDASVRYGGAYKGKCGSGNLWMEVGYPPTNQGINGGHGAEAQVLRDYLSISIAIYDENPSWYNHVAARIYNEAIPFRNYYFQSGMYPQGISTYWGHRYQSDTWCAWLLLCATGENPYTDDMQKVTNTILDMRMPGGSFFGGGDGVRNQVDTQQLMNAAALTAAIYGDARLRDAVVNFFGQGFYTGNGDYIRYSHEGRSTNFSVVHHVICSATYSQKASAGTSWDGTAIDQWNGSPITYNSSPVGQMIARSAWDNENAPAVLMLIGEKGTSNHEHADSGTFQLYYKGLYTGDSGVYATYGQTHWQYYHQATVAHNGLLVFNPSQYNASSNTAKWYTGGQRHGYDGDTETLEKWIASKATDLATVTGHEYALKADGTADYAYLAGDISQAYDTFTQATYVGRNMLTVFTDDPDYPMYFIVYDKIETVKSDIVNKFLLHTPTEPVVDETNKTVTVTKGDARLVLHSLKGGGEITALGGANRNYLINGVQCNSNGGTATVGSDGMWGRVEISNTGSKNSEFFNVIYFTDATNDEKQTPVLFEGGNYIGTKAGDDFVIFAKSEERSTEKLTFETEGTGINRYFVLGLHAGTWSVEVDGVTVAQKVVSEDGGMIAFYASAGNVSIIPGDDIPTHSSELENYEKYGIGLSCEHEWTYSHTHDADGLTSTVTVSCETCGTEETKTLHSGEYNLSQKEFEREMAQSGRGEDILVNTEFSKDEGNRTDASFDNFAGSPLRKGGYSAWEQMVEVEDGDGDYYIKWQKPKNVSDNSDHTIGVWGGTEYLEYQGTSLKSSSYNTFKSAGKIGAAYAITLDFLWYGESAVGGSTGIIDWNTSNIGSSFASVKSDCNFRISAAGVLQVYDVTKPEYEEWVNTTYTLTPGEWVQITLYHTPRGLNGVKDIEVTDNGDGTYSYAHTADYDDNTYHVFVDGVHIKSLQAARDAKEDNWTTSGDHINSLSDFTFQQIRLGLLSQSPAITTDLFALDDLRIYRGAFIECAHSTTEFGKCKLCGERVIGECNLDADTIEALFEANYKKVNEVFGEDTSDPTATTISNFAGSSLTKYGKAAFELIVSVQDENDENNYYLKWQRPKTPEGEDYTLGNWADTGYVEYAALPTWNYTNFAKAKSQKRLGAAYAITMDFMWYGESRVAPLLSANVSYVGNNLSGTVNGKNLQASCNFQISAAGVLQVCDAATGGWVNTTYTLTPGEWVQITLYHTPRGLNGVKDIEVTKNEDGTYSYAHTANYDDNTYHVFVNGKLVMGDIQAVASDLEIDWRHNDTATQVNSLSDFTLYRTRIGHLSQESITTDLFAMDDLRVYHGDFLECAHYDLNGELNVENGKCKGCGKDVAVNCVICERDVQFDGFALSADAAVANRNIELSESIELNLYLELTEKIYKSELAKVVLTCADGKRMAEYALSELEVLGEDSNAPGRYMVSLPLRSIDMASEVAAQVFVDGEKVGATYTTTVADYLKAVYAVSEDEAEKELIVAALNYGAYAQVYFAEKNNNDDLAKVLPNAGVEVDVTEQEDPNLAAYAPVVDGDASALTGVSLVLTSQAKMKIYLNTDAVTVTVVGEELDVVASGNKWCVTLEGSSPAELGAAKKVTFTWSDGTTAPTTVTVSVYSVLKAILEDGSASQSFKNLATAMYHYGEKAEAYVNKAA